MISKMPPLYATLTKSGRLSRNTDIEARMSTSLLLEKLVRFDLAKLSGQSLISDTEICKILKKSYRVLNHVRSTSAYLRKRVELTTGISADCDNSVKQSAEMHKQVLEMMMPDALRVLANQLRNNPTNSVEKRLQATIAIEVLDRQGTLPKISRSDIHAKVEHDYSSLDSVSKDLIASVDGPMQTTAADKAILELIEANKNFANSESIATSKQEVAMKILENTKIEGPVN